MGDMWGRGGGGNEGGGEVRDMRGEGRWGT